MNVRHVGPGSDVTDVRGDRRSVRRLDRVEAGALVALAGLSLIVLAALLTKGRALTGADGLLASDQLQYFTWIRQASEHVLIGNEYDMAPDHRVFLHPGFLISGVLHDVTGISVPLSYLLWKPVAVGVAFAGTLLYVRRLLPAGGQRYAALILVLFAVMPASWLVAWTHWGGKPRQYTFDFISGEMATTQFMWGYLMTAIAVFLMPLTLLAFERWRTERRARPLVLAAVGALLVCWLQPWQGGTLALIVVAVEALEYRRTRERPSPAALAIPAAVAIPAIYYAILGRTDASWKLADESNAAGSQATWHWPWWAIVLSLLPLAAPAVLAYRLPTPGWQELAIRVWPFAALAVYLAPVGTFPYHSFQGLAIPLSILAVQGVASRWSPRPVLVVACLAAMTLPGIGHKLSVAINSIRAAGDPYFVFGGEQRALDALERDPRPGGVIAPTYAGHMLPYRTDREVYVGALSWTPDWAQRVRETQALFEGPMGATQARALVRRSQARFAFVDCRPHLRDLTALLGPLVERVDRYGCATVYVLRP
ncbi:MAG TPA: hypothetical protein VK510_04050 [Solirubrobacteraceae bacterium]|nr:hypothetical protein [Solirubrobacteraceae bacterium]